MPLKNLRKNLKTRLAGAKKKLSNHEREKKQKKNNHCTTSDDESENSVIYEDIHMSTDYLETARKPWSVDWENELISNQSQDQQDMSSAGGPTAHSRQSRASMSSAGTLFTGTNYMPSEHTIDREGDGSSQSSDDRNKLGIPPQFATARQAAFIKQKQHAKRDTIMSGANSISSMPRPSTNSLSIIGKIAQIFPSDRSVSTHTNSFEDVWSAEHSKHSMAGQSTSSVPKSYALPASFQRPPRPPSTPQSVHSGAPVSTIHPQPNSGTCSISACTIPQELQQQKQQQQQAPKKKTTHRSAAPHRVKNLATSQSTMGSKPPLNPRFSRSRHASQSTLHTDNSEAESAAAKPRRSQHTVYSAPVSSSKPRRSEKTIVSLPTKMEKKARKKKKKKKDQKEEELTSQFDAELQNLLEHVGTNHGVSSTSINKGRSRSRSPERKVRSGSKKPERRSRSKSTVSDKRSRSSSKVTERRGRSSSEKPEKRSRSSSKKRSSSAKPERRERSKSREHRSKDKSKDTERKSRDRSKSKERRSRDKSNERRSRDRSKTPDKRRTRSNSKLRGNVSRSSSKQLREEQKTNEATFGLSQSMHEAKAAKMAKNAGLSQSLHANKGMPKKVAKVAPNGLSQSLHYAPENTQQAPPQPPPKPNRHWFQIVPKTPLYQQKVVGPKQDPPGIPSPKTRRKMIDQQHGHSTPTTPKRSNASGKDDSTNGRGSSSSKHEKRRKPRRSNSGNAGFAALAQDPTKSPRRRKRNTEESTPRSTQEDEDSRTSESTASSIHSTSSRRGRNEISRNISAYKLPSNVSVAESITSTNTRGSAGKNTGPPMLPSMLRNSGVNIRRRRDRKDDDNQSVSNFSTASSIISTSKNGKNPLRWGKPAMNPFAKPQQ